MAKHTVELVANKGIFQGLAKQNMLFHQCIGELVDNAIAAKKQNEKFRINIILHREKGANENLKLFIADKGIGMTIDVLKKALQLGESPTSENRLNEHGFGLKNSLATLTSAVSKWKIYTKDFNTSKISSVEGPFGPEMIIEDDDKIPNIDYLPSDISTLIEVDVKFSFVQTVQGRGAPSTDLTRIRLWLIEHLGVFYRGYLEQNTTTYDYDGVILISIDNDTLQVPPIPIPIGRREVIYIDVELGGIPYKLEYIYGSLDTEKRNRIVRGEKAKYYYQGNTSTQGIDIRLGKRVIATKQFETIWQTKDPTEPKPLIRHNDYNDFIGELLIPELPRGVLTTVNNKTDFNLDDQDWERIFTLLNEHKPQRHIKSKSEAAIKRKWMQMLNATNPDENISDEISVWPTGVKIDVYRKTKPGELIIYEIKVGTGAPLNLYQLKMYWDGLVIEGQQPKEAILLVEDFNTNLEEMANKMNSMTPPDNSKPYNFKLEKNKDKGL